MIDVQHARLSYLDNMRAVAIVMVIIIHSMGYCGELTLVQSKFIGFLVKTIAVPVFFLVDGFLAVAIYNQKQLVYTSYVRSSFFRLMVPWLIFTVLYTLFRCLFEYVGVLPDKIIIGRPAAQVLLAMYGSVYAPQMYFLFSLFLIRLALPLVLWIVRQGNRLFFLLFCSYLVFYVNFAEALALYLRIEGGQEPILHAIWGGQFYLLGVLLKQNEESFRTSVRWIIPFSIVLVLFFKNIAVFEQYNYIVQYSYLVGYFSFFYILRNSRLDLSKIGVNTMGIYLLHAPVLLKVVSLVVLRFVSNGMFSLVLISVLCFTISYSITCLINRMPRGKVLFGTF